MRLRRRHFALLLVDGLCRTSNAVLVAPSSTCGVNCGNVLSSTSNSDITCGDSLYSSSSGGSVFESCVNCEASSTYVDPSSQQSDLDALLYNIRYTLSTCLFGYPGNYSASGGQCVLEPSCGSLQAAFQYGNLTSSSDPYAYCGYWPEDIVQRCEQCLQNLGNSNYLSNFVTVLDAACQQQPANGSTLALSGSIFSESPIAIATPTASNIASYTPPSSGSLSLGSKVGIAVAAIIAILILAGCTIVCHGKRRRRAHLRLLASNAPSMSARYQDRRGSHGGEGNSPQSDSSRAFMAPQPYAWQNNSGQPSHYNESPVSSMGEAAYFSPYSSTYNSPISPVLGRQWVSPIATSATASGAGGSAPLFGASFAKIKGTASAVTANTSEPQTHGDEIEMSRLAEAEDDHWRREAAYSGFTAPAAPVIAMPRPSRHQRDESFGVAI